MKLVVYLGDQTANTNLLNPFRTRSHVEERDGNKEARVAQHLAEVSQQKLGKRNVVVDV